MDDAWLLWCHRLIGCIKSREQLFNATIKRSPTRVVTIWGKRSQLHVSSVHCACMRYKPIVMNIGKGKVTLKVPNHICSDWKMGKAPMILKLCKAKATFSMTLLYHQALVESACLDSKTNLETCGYTLISKPLVTLITSITYHDPPCKSVSLGRCWWT